jgi:hypothetical protein
MQHSQWEIIILKPTHTFLSFLALQLPDVDLPELRLLKNDNTAYIMAKQHNDEETFNEIERHFAVMFRHEICRWLGEYAQNEIEGSFLDFICCFKFELHSHIVLMEQSISDGRHLLCVRPRSVLLKWMRSVIEEQSDYGDVVGCINLSHLADNATVVIKNFDDIVDIKSFLRLYYQTIFTAEMLRMSDRAEEWPKVDSYPEFCRYFAIDLHTQLIHLH